MFVNIKGEGCSICNVSCTIVRLCSARLRGHWFSTIALINIKQHKRKPLTLQSFQFAVISIELAVDNFCKKKRGGDGGTETG